jgi:hypothetical protein
MRLHSADMLQTGSHISHASRGSGRPLSNLRMPMLVIVMGTAIAFFVTRSCAYYIVAVAAVIVLGLALVRNLEIGLLAYLFIAALVIGESPGVQSPNSGYKAGLMPSQILLGFLAVLFVIRALFGGRFRLVRSPLNLPMLIIWIVSLCSMIAANLLQTGRENLFHQLLITQIAEVGLLGFSVVGYYLAANTFKDGRRIQFVFVPVALLGLSIAVPKLIGLGWEAPIAWPYLFLSASIAFVYARLLFHKPSAGSAAALAVLLGVMIYAAFRNSAWVSGWIAAAGAVLMISWFRSKALAVFLVLVIIFALFVYPGTYYSAYEESEYGGDFDRFTIWHDAFNMALEVNPILGVGPGNYVPYAFYLNTIRFGGGKTYTTAHSNYAQVAAELGLVGFAVFIWIVVAGVLTGVRAVRAAPPELRWLTIAALSIFSATAVASLAGDYLLPSRANNGLQSFGTTVYTWLIMGAAVAATDLGKEASVQKR